MVYKIADDFNEPWFYGVKCDQSANCVIVFCYWRKPCTKIIKILVRRYQKEIRF